MTRCWKRDNLALSRCSRWVNVTKVHLKVLIMSLSRSFCWMLLRKVHPSTQVVQECGTKCESSDIEWCLRWLLRFEERHFECFQEHQGDSHYYEGVDFHARRETIVQTFNKQLHMYDIQSHVKGLLRQISKHRKQKIDEFVTRSDKILPHPSSFGFVNLMASYVDANDIAHKIFFHNELRML